MEEEGRRRGYAGLKVGGKEILSGRFEDEREGRRARKEKKKRRVGGG